MTPKNILNIGFDISNHNNNSRLQVVRLSKKTIQEFSKQIIGHDVQSIEYKPFLRFFLANCLNKLTEDTLGHYLLDTIKDRSRGAVLLECESLEASTLNGIDFIDFNILLSTASI